MLADQERHPPYGTNLTFPLDRYTRFHQTSGTTGAPLRWLDTPESWDWMVANWTEILRAAGATSSDRVFFAFSFGPFIGFWLAYEAAQHIGCLCIPGGGLSSPAQNARGLLQVLPATGASLKLDVNHPSSNVLAGARYLRLLLDRYNRTDLALAAYNAGPTTIDLNHDVLGPISMRYVANVEDRWAALAGCS